MPDPWLGPAGVTGVTHTRGAPHNQHHHEPPGWVADHLPLPVMVLLLACLCVKAQFYPPLHPLHTPCASRPTDHPRVSPAWANSGFCR